MKNSALMLFLFLFLASCADDRRSGVAEPGNENTTVETANTQPQAPTVANDSISTTVPVKSTDTVAKEKAGKHPITLQWIGWDKPGSAIITPSANGWYTITGKQLTNDRNYLRIDGKIRRLSEKALEFDGTIETRVETIYGGEPCIRKGPQRFFGKGTRTYFRLQNMENCEGGNLVDYVDIYPGSSSL